MQGDEGIQHPFDGLNITRKYAGGEFQREDMIASQVKIHRKQCGRNHLLGIVLNAHIQFKVGLPAIGQKLLQRDGYIATDISVTVNLLV